MTRQPDPQAAGLEKRETSLDEVFGAPIAELRSRFDTGPSPTIAELRELTSDAPADARDELLIDLIREHLRECWCRGVGKPRIEDYVAEFGRDVRELSSLATAPVELVEAEFIARHASSPAADHPTLAEYERRFPHRPEISDALRNRCFDGEHYVRIRLEGRGGLGRVWLAFDRHLGRYVALKEPIPGAPDEQQVVQRLAREARLTARLDHPAIVAVHEYRETAGDSPFYVMRLVHGKTLAELIQDHENGTHSRGQRRILRNRILEAFVDTCEAVALAHSKGIIHRDLKPQNIIVGEFGETVVVDWGLAKPVLATRQRRGSSDQENPTARTPASSEHEGASSSTTTLSFDHEVMPQQQELAETTSNAARDTDHDNAADNPDSPYAPQTFLTEVAGMVGTPAYMAPEQAVGASLPASDIFSLGAVLYHVLTGRPPYPGRSSDKLLLDRVKRGSYTKPSTLRRRVSRSLESICLKAMAPEPAQRYVSASALATDVRSWLADEPVSCYPNEIWHRVARLARRQTAATATVLVAVMLLMVGVMLWFRLQAIKDFRSSLLQEAQQTLLMTHNAGWSQQAWELFEQAASLGHDEALRDQAVASLAGMDAHRVKQFDFPTYDVAYDSSGERLLIAGRDGRPRLYETRTDELTVLKELGTGPVVFDPEDTPLLFVPTGARRCLVYDLDDGQEIQELVLPFAGGDEVQEPLDEIALRPSPDGSRCAMSTTLADDAEITVVWDVRTGEMLYQAPQRSTAFAFSRDGSRLAAGDALGHITIWSVPDGRELMSLQGESIQIDSLAFGPDPKRRLDVQSELSFVESGLLAAGDAGGTITIWDLTQAIPRSYCRGSLHNIYAIAFSPDGMSMASCGRTHVHLWDVASGTRVLSMPAVSYVTGLAFTSDGSQLTAGGYDPGREDAVAMTWQLEASRGIHDFRGLDGAGAKVALSKSGRLLAGLTHTWQVGIWSLEDDRLLHVLDVPDGLYVDSSGMAFDAEEKRFAFASGRDATLWDVETGKLLKRWTLPPGLCDNLSFPSTGDRLILGRLETVTGKPPFKAYKAPEHRRICRFRNLFAADYENPLWEVDRLDKHVYEIQMASDGSLVIVDGLENTDPPLHLIVSYDSQSGRELWAKQALPDRSCGIQLDVSGTFLYSYCNSGTGPLCDSRSGELIQELPQGRIYLSPFATHYTIEGTDDFTLYERKSGDLLTTFATGSRPSPDGLRFSTDGRLIAWADYAGGIYVAEIEEVRRKLATIGLGW